MQTSAQSKPKTDRKRTLEQVLHGLVADGLVSRDDFITSSCDITLVREQAYKDGMKPLRIRGAMKVAAGLTTMEEVLKVTPPTQMISVSS